MKLLNALVVASLLLSAQLFSTSDMPYCADTILEIGIDEISDLGFSGRDLLSLTEGSKSFDWNWDYKEGSTRLNLWVASAASTARYIDSVAIYPEGGPEIGIICPDRLEVDAWINFQTDDGAFDERWYTTIYDTDGSDCMTETGDPCLDPGTEANFRYGFRYPDLMGNFYSEIEVPTDLSIDFYAEGKFNAESCYANVYGQAYSCAEELCYTYYIHGGHTE